MIAELLIILGIVAVVWPFMWFVDTTEQQKKCSIDDLGQRRPLTFLLIILLTVVLGNMVFMNAWIVPSSNGQRNMAVSIGAFVLATVLFLIAYAYTSTCDFPTNFYNALSKGIMIGLLTALCNYVVLDVANYVIEHQLFVPTDTYVPPSSDISPSSIPESPVVAVVEPEVNISAPS